MVRGERGWIGEFAVNPARLGPGYENVSVTRQLQQIMDIIARGPVMKMNQRYDPTHSFPHSTHIISCDSEAGTWIRKQFCDSPAQANNGRNC